MDCGGKRSATPLWLAANASLLASCLSTRKRRRRCALPAQSKIRLSGSRFLVSFDLQQWTRIGHHEPPNADFCCICNKGLPVHGKVFVSPSWVLGESEQPKSTGGTR
jgi:hypothetical protein